MEDAAGSISQVIKVAFNIPDTDTASDSASDCNVGC